MDSGTMIEFRLIMRRSLNKQKSALYGGLYWGKISENNKSVKSFRVSPDRVLDTRIGGVLAKVSLDQYKEDICYQEYVETTASDYTKTLVKALLWGFNNIPEKFLKRVVINWCPVKESYNYKPISIKRKIKTSKGKKYAKYHRSFK